MGDSTRNVCRIYHGIATHDRDPVNDLLAYCRVSTTKEEQEESLEMQSAWAERFVRERGAQEGAMTLPSAWPTDARPVDLPIHARFVGADGRARTPLVAGYDRPRIVSYESGRRRTGGRGRPALFE